MLLKAAATHLQETQTMRITKLTTVTAALVAAGAFAASGAGATTSGPVYAHTPTGNITCKAQHSHLGWSLVCSAADPGRTLRISTARVAYQTGYSPVALRGPSMLYGHRYWLGPFRCDSSSRELTCVRPADRYGPPAGFELSRQAGYVYENDDWGW
jgi:hypothetical protein